MRSSRTRTCKRDSTIVPAFSSAQGDNVCMSCMPSEQSLRLRYSQLPRLVLSTPVAIAKANALLDHVVVVGHASRH